MFEPKREDLLSIADGNEYLLTNVVGKRARQLIEGDTPRVKLVNPSKKAITLASEEFLTAKTRIVRDA